MLIKFFDSEEAATQFGLALDKACGLPTPNRRLRGVAIEKELTQTEHLEGPRVEEDESGQERWAYGVALEHKDGAEVQLEGRKVALSFAGAVRKESLDSAKKARLEIAEALEESERAKVKK